MQAQRCVSSPESWEWIWHRYKAVHIINGLSKKMCMRMSNSGYSNRLLCKPARQRQQRKDYRHYLI